MNSSPRHSHPPPPTSTSTSTSTSTFLSATSPPPSRKTWSTLSLTRPRCSRIPTSPPGRRTTNPSTSSPTLPSLRLSFSAPTVRLPTIAVPKVSTPLSRLPTPFAPPVAQPRHLLVLSHGLQGTVEDFNFLLATLYDTPSAREGELLVHASGVNVDKTHDGITLGGLRLAEDIERVVRENGTLERISVIGFSLGGLYVRYAIGHLYDAQTGRIGGLRPCDVFIIASPNLGVRSFGVFRFIPRGVWNFANLLFGETMKQLLFLDEAAVMEGMTRENGTYMRALGAFQRRFLFANLRNDLMVNYGTAALHAEVTEMGGSAINAQNLCGSSDVIDADFDHKGCRVVFCKHIAGVARGGGEVGVEKVMESRLKQLGWNVVAVDYKGGNAIAHNRIVAMSRNAFHSWLNDCGKRIVLFLVDRVCEGVVMAAGDGDGDGDEREDVRNRGAGGGERGGSGGGGGGGDTYGTRAMHETLFERVQESSR